MRIAIFTDTYKPDINGVATSTSILQSELEKHNHEVLIVTTTLPKDSSYIDDTTNIVRVKSISLKKIYGYRLAPLFSPDSLKKIKMFQPDIIHIQTEFGVGIFGKIVGELLKIPVVYTYHTMWSDYTHYISKGIVAVDSIMKFIIKKISKIYGNSCTELIVPSMKTAEILKTYGINHTIHVIPTGIMLDQFQITDTTRLNQIKQELNIENKRIFLYLGRIAKEKSIDLILEAFASSSLSNDILLVVGDGPDKQELSNLAYKLSNRIMFLGSKSFEEVPYYYHLAHYFISASITETQGLTYIEAMASGRPVIARYDKNLEEVINQGVNGFFFSNKQELEDLIKTIDTYPYDHLCIEALNKAQQYSSNQFYQSIMKVYKKAMNDE